MSNKYRRIAVIHNDERIGKFLSNIGINEKIIEQFGNDQSQHFTLTFSPNCYIFFIQWNLKRFET